MDTRTLTIEVPEPEHDEQCNEECPLFGICWMWERFEPSSVGYDDAPPDPDYYPGPGCPWYGEQK